MEEVIRRSPEQFVAGMKAAERVSLPSGPLTHVLIAGMGGSWMGGQLIADAGLVTVPVLVHRNYDLPSLPSSRTLVIASSFSGNTEETLSAYAAARAAGFPLIGVAAGGELERRCAADGATFLKIPADPPSMQPRSATGYSVGIFAQIFTRLELATPGAVEALTALPVYLSSIMESARRRGGELALPLASMTPIVYGSAAFGTVAQIWKIKINENAKTPAFTNVFPELNHNEMIGWTNPHGTFHALFLLEPDAHPRLRKRIESTAELLRPHGVSGTLVPIEGRTRLEQIFGTLLVGDWLSYALALALGVDPSPVQMVEDLKKRLKE